MSAKLSVRLAVALTAVILFGGTGYLGYRFIQDVSRSAESITSNMGQAASSVAINDETLSAGQKNQTLALAASLPEWVQAEQGVSSGQDVVIKAGEFVYRNGVPQVRLSLLNQGGFTVGGVFVGFKLYLDGSSEPIAPMVIVEAQFTENLATGSNTLATFNIEDPRWQTAEVREAKNRRVVAQIVAVGDSERGGADYQQVSAGVLLRQTANDWSKKLLPSEAAGVSLRESASQVHTVSPNIEVQADMEQAVQNVPENTQNPNDISEFLEKKPPTGEPRIISVEVQEYKDGELQQSEKKE